LVCEGDEVNLRPSTPAFVDKVIENKGAAITAAFFGVDHVFASFGVADKRGAAISRLGRHRWGRGY
jgi:hypothetical protein